MPRAEVTALGALLSAALLVRVALALVTPPFQNPDERAHLRYVEHLGVERALPVQPELDLEESLRFWPQYYQPPLAYGLFLPAWSLARAAGAGEVATLRLLRCQNALYGTLTVLVAWLLMARLTSPGDPRRLAAAAVVAFLPGFAANGAALNNDSLANLLAAALWLPLLAMRTSTAAAVGAGAVFGLAANAKLTVLPLAPLLLLVPWLERRDDPAGALHAALRAGLVAAAVLVPLAVRNALVYGHPLAIGAGSLSPGWLAAQLPAGKVAELMRAAPHEALLEFFGQFGIYTALRWAPVPAVWSALVLASLAGFALRRAAAPPPLDGRAASLLAPVALAALGLTYFSFSYYGGWQGRYLYTAVVPAAALLAEGGLRWARGDRARPTAWGVAAGLFALDLGLVVVLARFFARVPELRWHFAGWL